MPQIRSTQTAGVPVWVKGSLVLVAQGMVIQSVAQVVPTLLPSAGVPPVMLKDMAGGLTRIEKKSSSIILNVKDFLKVVPVSGQAVYCIPQKFLSILTQME